jgi:hypothetical protein
MVKPTALEKSSRKRGHNDHGNHWSWEDRDDSSAAPRQRRRAGDPHVYYAGDRAYGTHFRQAYEKYGAPRVSLLPFGADEPRWFMYRMHMSPDEAVRARDLHSQSSIGIHFGLIDNAGEITTRP